MNFYRTKVFFNLIDPPGDSFVVFSGGLAGVC